MIDFRRKHEFVMTNFQMLGSVFNSVNLPGNFKTCGFFCFLRILNYMQIIFSITVTSICTGLN